MAQCNIDFEAGNALTWSANIEGAGMFIFRLWLDPEAGPHASVVFRPALPEKVLFDGSVPEEKV